METLEKEAKENSSSGRTMAREQCEERTNKEDEKGKTRLQDPRKSSSNEKRELWISWNFENHRHFETLLRSRANSKIRRKFEETEYANIPITFQRPI